MTELKENQIPLEQDSHIINHERIKADIRTNPDKQEIKRRLEIVAGIYNRYRKRR